MSAYDLEEQEQLAELKAWWKENGNKLISLAALVLFVIAAWNGWNWYQRSQAAQAAALYDTLQKAARANDLKTVRDTAGSILEKYARTAYAPLAALISAKSHFQAADAKTARAQLEWAVEHTRSDELRATAALRLAEVLLDDGALDAALKALDTKPPVSFDALFAAMRGDIFVAQKKTAEAREAYKLALEKAGVTGSALRDSVRIKLDALGTN